MFVENLTNVNIPDDVLHVLSYGPKFSTHRDSFDNKSAVEVIKNLESSLGGIEINDNIKNSIRNKATKIIVNNLNNKKHLTSEQRAFQMKITRTVKFIKENPKILITNSDKSNKTVCMWKEEYLDKMNRLLKDTNTYKELECDPTNMLRSSVYGILRRLNDNKYLNRHFHNNDLTQTNTILAKCYGLPKIHKKDIPLRPIISTINSPTHFLSKTLYDSIKNAIPLPKSHIDNSRTFVKIMNNFSVPDGYTLISLDVVSLFTCIPCDLVLTALDRRYQHLRHCSIPFEEIRRCVQFLFDNTFFTFDNKFYQQTFGTPMGSNISPLFADMVMNDLETDVLKRLRDEHNFMPLFYFRYVDDSIMCLRSEDINLVLTAFNSYNQFLKFTHELSTDNSINFLDTTVTIDNGSIINNWYRKSSSSGRFLDFNSNHPESLKINMIYNLVDRAILLSHERFHVENLRIVRELLESNSYPKQFFNRFIHLRLEKIHCTNNSLNSLGRDSDGSSRKNRIAVVVPFINQILFKKLKLLYDKFSLTAIPKINNDFSKYIRLGKDSTSTLDSTNVVYKLSCTGCSATYIGETKRQLKERIAEHRRIKKSETVVAKRCHTYKWQNVTILDREANWYKRVVSEMVNINFHPHNINCKDDVKRLSKTYNPLFHEIKID
ncbi:hypothetical protein TKK_0000317 [Trichogramma kaykai]